MPLAPTYTNAQLAATTLQIQAGDISAATNTMLLNTTNGPTVVAGFEMPTLAVAASLVLEMSLDNGVTWLSNLLPPFGGVAWNTYPTSVQTTGTFQAIDPASILGATAIRFVAGGTAPVTQTATVPIIVMTRAIQ